MVDNQERHYNITKLNILFSLASLVLLGSLIFMFADDYSREWKDYQKKFRELEIENTKEKYNTEFERISATEDYKSLLQKTQDAKTQATAQSAEIKSIENETADVSARYDILNQQYQFAKAQYDATKYGYESAVGEKQGDSGTIKKELDKLEQESSRLREEVEDTKKQIDDFNQKILDKNSQLMENERELKSFTKQADILEKKLKKIDPKEMNLTNKIADKFRDLPIMDLANPNYKVQQIVLRDITDNVNFMRVPKVDRCITCHLGIANPDFKDAPQPFRTHPDLELFVDNKSKHPMEEFGCTTCHGGRGRGTDFVSAYHMPSSPEQKTEWEKKYHWHDFHYWEAPMYPKKYVEASCFKCHSGETVIKGAEKLNLGLNLIEKAGCYGCHVIEKYKDWPKVGPDLNNISSKTTSDWAYQWIKDPKAFRHNTWMPSFFGLSNNSNEESQKRSEQEIHAIVYYLFEKSKEHLLDSMQHLGDPQKGEEVVASLGCFGCHQIQPEPTQTKMTIQSLKKQHGPNLIGLGTKTTKVWIYNWLKDPKRYHPQTRMPNLRLTDQEAADAAAYLSADKSQDYLKKPPPLIDEALLNKITEEFLSKTTTVKDAHSQIEKMKLDEKLDYTGKKLIRHYGCFACHNIPGFENEKPIGTELSEEGSKAADRLDFGFIHIEHSKDAWFTQKLKDPRIFDRDRIRAADEKLRMPNFHFTDEEAEAIVTALLGFVNETPEATKIRPRTPKNLFIEEGQKIVRQFNCQGCHIIEGEGGAIQPDITAWLTKFEGKESSEAQAITTGFSPPNLIGEGKKVQAEWLFNFIHQPTPIRPWLKVRMPSYDFDSVHINALVKYFNYLDDQDFPFVESANTEMTGEEHAAAEKLFSKDYFDCTTCHIVGDKMPGGTPDRWAPNFALAKFRLKPEWIMEWLKNPADLLPGTKMPTYFDPQYFDQSGPDDVLGGDEKAQIKALRDYVLTLSESASTKVESAEETNIQEPVETPKEISPELIPVPATDPSSQ